MARQPKVACVELRCILRDYHKTNDFCKVCKHRWEFNQAIEEGHEFLCEGCEMGYNPFMGGAV